MPIISALPKEADSFRASAFGKGTVVGVGESMATAVTTAVVGIEVGNGDWTCGDVVVHPEHRRRKNRTPKNKIVYLIFMQTLRLCGSCIYFGWKHPFKEEIRYLF